MNPWAPQFQWGLPVWLLAKNRCSHIDVIQHLHGGWLGQLVGDIIEQLHIGAAGEEANSAAQFQSLHKQPRLENFADHVHPTGRFIEFDRQRVGCEIGDSTMQRMNQASLVVMFGRAVAVQAAADDQFVKSLEPTDSAGIKKGNPGGVDGTGHGRIPAKADAGRGHLPDRHAAGRQDDHLHRSGIDLDHFDLIGRATDKSAVSGANHAGPCLNRHREGRFLVPANGFPAIADGAKSGGLRRHGADFCRFGSGFVLILTSGCRPGPWEFLYPAEPANKTLTPAHCQSWLSYRIIAENSGPFVRVGGPKGSPIRAQMTSHPLFWSK